PTARDLQPVERARGSGREYSSGGAGGEILERAAIERPRLPAVLYGCHRTVEPFAVPEADDIGIPTRLLAPDGRIAVLEDTSLGREVDALVQIQVQGIAGGVTHPAVVQAALARIPVGSVVVATDISAGESRVVVGELYVAEGHPDR